MLRIIKIVHRHYNPRLSYCTTGHTKEDKAIMEMDVNERVRPQVKDIDHYRNNITDLYYATYSVYPQPVAFIYLFDPDQWKIVGEEAVTPVELDGHIVIMRIGHKHVACLVIAIVIIIAWLFNANQLPGFISEFLPLFLQVLILCRSSKMCKIESMYLYRRRTVCYTQSQIIINNFPALPMSVRIPAVPAGRSL